MAATKAATRKPRRKDKKNVVVGQAHIKSTFNNTIVSITDTTGAVISCAANGVDLREPLKPTPPEEAQLITAPVVSVIETRVLLKVDLMWAWPTATFFLSLRRGLRAAVFGAAIECSPET